MIAFNLVLSLLTVGALTAVAGLGYVVGAAGERTAALPLKRRPERAQELEAA